MTAIVVPIHRHEFEGYNNNAESSISETRDDELPTNDLTDQEAESHLSLADGQETDAENDDSSMEDVSLPVVSLPTQLGGLNNMGNTCYLNSALQMLASLDDFGKRIKVPYDSKLRESLVDVLQRLRNGQTVRPDDFKKVVDERSPLFLGYRQQDAHEFLTTLLDLLDEDYKKEHEKEDDSANDNGDAEAEDEQMEDATSEEAPGGATDEEFESEDENYVLVSPVKRQKLDETSSEMSSSDDGSAFSSFKDLQFSDIENLLYGSGAASPAPADSAKEEAPKCKLVGGRMSTTGVQLTPFENGDSIPEEAAVPEKTESDEDMSDDDGYQSPIDSSFATEVRVCLTCDSCKFRRSHTEKYLHLSLEIGENCSSIEDGLRKFFSPEKREIKCEKCFCETASQTTEITRLPRAMLFHLKRFIVNVSPDYTSISYSKDQAPVSFGESLPFGQDSVLSEFLAGDVSLPEGGSSYSIRSVVNHIGSSASCGHYTADAWRRYDSGREWTRFNDSMVSRISDQEAMQNSARTAYMIMYEIGH